MPANVLATNPAADVDVVRIRKERLIATWMLLERLVVSLDKIGSYYSTPSEHEPLPPDKQQEMNAAISELMNADTFHEMALARGYLSDLIDDDEGEALSDSLPFWKAPAAPATQD